MNKTDVQRLTAINDDLLHRRNISPSAHDRNRRSIVASFMAGDSPDGVHIIGLVDPKGDKGKGIASDSPLSTLPRVHVTPPPDEHLKTLTKAKDPTSTNNREEKPKEDKGKDEAEQPQIVLPDKGKAEETVNPPEPKKKEVLDMAGPSPRDPGVKTIPHAEWFDMIVGCDEKALSQSRLRSFYEIKNAVDKDCKKYGNPFTLKNQATDRVFHCGQFKVLKYEDLMEELGMKKKKGIKAELKKQSASQAKPCVFEIVTRTDDASLRFVDVAYLQCLKENHNALFQVATNFNAVNGINEQSPPDRDEFTENYSMQAQQGPVASVSAGAGAIYRVHAAFHNGKKADKEWGQTAKHQINFLGGGKLPKHFPMVNGYVVYTGGEPKSFPKEGTKTYKKLMNNYQVAYHRGQEVVFGHRRTETFELATTPDQRVDHICCAAVNMLQGLTGLENKKYDAKRNKMQFVLQAVYSTTYMTAIYGGRESIILTLIGGGAFGNEIPMILSAIQNAHLEWTKHSQSKIKKVTLVLFRAPKELPGWIQGMVNAGIPVVHTEYTGGKPKKQKVPTAESGKK